ncbi:hypothetical protein F5J12DRAFT_785269 [Pisolithus orientalis]|uniref:uncharacterized protein n=1 Tax=Pisolithus orientalis TaxID=936130 RepID=UPI002224D2D5|nr:uncharacterized protein F5J12DRAFT_785269 [Pisolithus orientalis]KAI5996849.1 hypothetical protein F5J12DRAFT_785269 [Pisolithus orientalis]
MTTYQVSSFVRVDTPGVRPAHPPSSAITIINVPRLSELDKIGRWSSEGGGTSGTIFDLVDTSGLSLHRDVSGVISAVPQLKRSNVNVIGDFPNTPIRTAIYDCYSSFFFSPSIGCKFIIFHCACNCTEGYIGRTYRTSGTQRWWHWVGSWYPRLRRRPLLTNIVLVVAVVTALYSSSKIVVLKDVAVERRPVVPLFFVHLPCLPIHVHIRGSDSGVGGRVSVFAGDGVRMGEKRIWRTRYKRKLREWQELGRVVMLLSGRHVAT